jgi:hypothetical protein
MGDCRLLALLGLIFLIYGFLNLTPQTWARTTGTVGRSSATTRSAGSGPARQMDQVCDVTWTADGTSHTAPVDLGIRPHRTGRPSRSGSTATTPDWSSQPG